MKAMFNDVKSFAVFNAKQHLFAFSAPYQLGASCVNSPVFVDLAGGRKDQFSSRVEQFGGVVLNA